MLHEIYSAINPQGVFWEPRGGGGTTREQREENDRLWNEKKKASRENNQNIAHGTHIKGTYVHYGQGQPGKESGQKK